MKFYFKITCLLAAVMLVRSKTSKKSLELKASGVHIVDAQVRFGRIQKSKTRDQIERPDRVRNRRGDWSGG